MDNKKVDDILSEYEKLNEEINLQTYDEIKELQEQIDNGNMVTTPLFIELLACYELLDGKNELFEVPEKYLNLAYERAMNDINFQREVGNAYICLAMFSNLKKFKEKALFYYNKAIETEPTNTDFYIKRGSYFRSIKKNKESNADYKKALSLRPDDVTLQILCKTDFSEPSKFKEVLTIIAIVACVILSILAEIY